MNSTFQNLRTALHHPNLGLLVIRLVVGGILAYAGFGKFMGGTQTLHAVGQAINSLGLDVGSQNVSTLFFGALAAGSELAGGVLLILGLFFRTSAFFLFMTMLVATLSVYSSSGGNFGQYGYPLVMASVVLGLLFTGPGRISLQKE